MNSLIILGSTSFLGRELIKYIKKTNPNIFIKAVVRKIPKDLENSYENIEWIKVDIINLSVLNKIFTKNDIVINLTYIRDDHLKNNIDLINSIVDACISSKVSRLVHCSTASVYGDTKTKIINESTKCIPKISYEKIKMRIEEIVSNASLSGIDIGILRPTAIVGYNGKNLKKLVNSLIYGNKIKNYFKKCLMRKMPMHLVPVRDVVAALLLLSFSKKKLNNNVFIISSDDDHDNNYQRVEEILSNELHLKVNKFPTIFIPMIFQKLIFKIIKRNDINLERIYDSKKIRDYGFVPIDTVKDAILQFILSIKKKNLHKDNI